MPLTAVSILEARYLLGLTAEADRAQVTREYRRRARSVHPDVDPQPDAAARFHALTEAYRVALDAARLSPSTGTGLVSRDAAPVPVEAEADVMAGEVHHDPPVFLADATGHASPPVSRPVLPIVSLTAAVVRLGPAGGAVSRASGGAFR